MKFLPVVICVGLVLQGCAISGLTRNSDTPALEDTSDPVSGIVGGGLVTRAAGDELTRREWLQALGAEYRALETAPATQPVAWRDERTGNAGSVVAEQPYRVGSQDCRPYEHEVEVEGVSRSARGTACRNEDGSWTLLN